MKDTIAQPTCLASLKERLRSLGSVDTEFTWGHITLSNAINHLVCVHGASWLANLVTEATSTIPSVKNCPSFYVKLISRGNDVHATFSCGDSFLHHQLVRNANFPIPKISLCFIRGLLQISSQETEYRS